MTFKYGSVRGAVGNDRSYRDPGAQLSARESERAPNGTVGHALINRTFFS